MVTLVMLITIVTMMATLNVMMSTVALSTKTRHCFLLRNLTPLTFLNLIRIIFDIFSFPWKSLLYLNTRMSLNRKHTSTKAQHRYCMIQSGCAKLHTLIDISSLNEPDYYFFFFSIKIPEISINAHNDKEREKYRTVGVCVCRPVQFPST